MAKYIVKDKARAGRNVLLLSLQPEQSHDAITYNAGQYVSIGFKRGGRRTPMRSFSVVSSPKDTSTLQVAMRVQGNFTGVASQVEVGDAAYVQGPFGNFIINPDYDENIIMMAGGIGITPFISMLRYATEASLPVNITLLYSCRSQDDIPFYDELLQLQRRNPNLRILFFVTGGVSWCLEYAALVRCVI